jgi:hypothetical protein
MFLNIIQDHKSIIAFTKLNSQVQKLKVAPELQNTLEVKSQKNQLINIYLEK